MSYLIISVKKKFYDMIESGEMREAYKPFTKYWYKRFMNAGMRSKNLDGSPYLMIVEFRNGLGKDVPTLIAECTARVGRGKPEFGADPYEPDTEYFILDIIRVWPKWPGDA